MLITHSWGQHLNLYNLPALLPSCFALREFCRSALRLWTSGPCRPGTVYDNPARGDAQEAIFTGGADSAVATPCPRYPRFAVVFEWRNVLHSDKCSI